ncbi:28_t:CDS:1 [Acaulospora colombiana]|uniref:28_t:CDS:1 n=1 Tax=Acaulospora colombiana TaxID=27376 RepID=A0ACA9KUN8_9GLOM|nr:28_t:CDS:1 [Acaulospora colombiana]
MVTKKLMNIFHHNKKNPSVSPNEKEWTPSFAALDLSHPAHSHYSHSKYTRPRRSSKEPQKPVPVVRTNSVQRRHSYSNVHENGQQRLAALKQAEYREKMEAFEDLIQKRRGSTLRVLAAPDASGC